MLFKYNCSVSGGIIAWEHEAAAPLITDCRRLNRVTGGWKEHCIVPSLTTESASFLIPNCKGGA